MWCRLRGGGLHDLCVCDVGFVVGFCCLFFVFVFSICDDYGALVCLIMFLLFVSTICFYYL